MTAAAHGQQARGGSRRRPCLAVIVGSVMLVGGACFGGSRLPAVVGDQEFWDLVAAISEPAGTFTLSDNVVSNEPNFANTVRWIRPTDGAYIGVGPEQNFSYIAALRPAIAFIVDIRRENLHLHLLYKALFELSTDRADFVSRLFSRPRPPGLSADSGVDEIFEQYDRVPASSAEYTRNAALVRERLLMVRGFRLPQADIDSIDLVLRVFYTAGPNIDYYGSRPIDAVRPSYRQLMTARDLSGQARSFLATEEAFRFVKQLQARNLVVPVVGDFGGPSAIRRVGDYVRERGGVVQAVYGSNVSVYLTNQQTQAFCRNLAALPAAPRAWFIDSRGMRPLASKLSDCQ